MVWAVPVIFAVSMGGLYLGIFTPTESGAAGAFLALMYGLVTRRLNRAALSASVSESITVSAQIFLLMIAGQMFGFFLAVTRIPMWLGRTVEEMNLTPWLVVGLIFLIYFALGAVMDEMVRIARRWVLCGEYYDRATVEVLIRSARSALAQGATEIAVAWTAPAMAITRIPGTTYSRY